MTSYNCNWTTVGNTFIQNVLLYDNIKIPLHDNCLFESCPYGGPIAIALPTDNGRDAWKILIFTANGKILSSLKASAISLLLWSRDQKLIVIGPTGRVLLYNALGELLHNFDTGKETNEFGISEAKTFPFDSGTGLAVLSKQNNFYGFDSINNRALWRVQDFERKSEPPTCWTIISIPTKPTLVLSCVKTKFYLGQMQSAIEICNFEWALKDGSYTVIEPTFEKSMIAFGHDSGRIQIVTGDLKTLLYSVEFAYKTLFHKPLMWCANNTLATQIDPQSIQVCEFVTNTNHTFNFNRPIRIGLENDMIRVFTSNSSSFLSPVPDCLVNTLGVTSSSSSALLFDASKKLEQNCMSSDVYSYVNMIGDKINNAVDDCIRSAAHHFDPKVQKELLKVASIGMVLCGRYERSQFVDVAHKLRLLNAVRFFGLPLSFQQLEDLSVESLVNRLVALRQWALALQICSFMGIDAEKGVYKVLAYWCRVLMDGFKKGFENNGKGDQTNLAHKIVARLDEHSGVSYADVAMEAAKKELHTVAKILVNREPNQARQIQVLLKMKDVENALSKAVDSQQPNLLHLVLNHMRKTTSAADFQLTLSKIPQALFLYQSSVHDEAPDRALTLYKQNDDFVRQAIYYLDQAEKSSSEFEPTKMLSDLLEASRAFHLLRDTQAMQLVEQAVHLVDEQSKLEEKFNVALIDKNPRDMFIWAVKNDHTSVADLIRKQHKLDDKQCWLWTVQGFAEGKRWPQLEQFGRSKKSAIGYLPLIEACYTHGNPALARRFMDKITLYEDQIKALVCLKDNIRAAQLAAEKHDINALQLIRRRLLVSSDEWKEITKIIETFDKRNF